MLLNNLVSMSCCNPKEKGEKKKWRIVQGVSDVHTSAGYFQVLLYEMKSNKRFILDKLTSWF